MLFQLGYHGNRVSSILVQIYGFHISQKPLHSIVRIPIAGRKIKQTIMNMFHLTRRAAPKATEAYRMDPAVNEIDKTKIAYEASKSYVTDRFPEFQEVFDELWNLSTANLDKKAKVPQLKKDFGGLNFVVDSSIIPLINLAIPFISGVVTSILSEIIIQKTSIRQKKTIEIAEDKAERVRVSLNMSKKAANELLPYILSELAKSSKDSSEKRKMKNPASVITRAKIGNA